MLAKARTSPLLTDSRYAKAAARASGEERQSITAEIAAAAEAAAGSAAIFGQYCSRRLWKDYEDDGVARVRGGALACGGRAGGAARV